MTDTRKQKLILIGGGGHCLSAIGVIESTNQYTILGILDASKKVGEDVLGYEIVGNDNDIAFWREQGAGFAITVGQLENSNIRRTIFDRVKSQGGQLPVIIASTAWVSPYASIGEGTIVFHKAVINTSSVIGENNIINTGCIIEHNTIVGNDNHISTSVTINGDCVVGNRNFLGCGCSVHHSIKIENNVVVGAGAVVVKDCTANGVYIGVPAKRIL